LKEFGMLAYAAHRRTVAGRKPAPHALLVIIVAHIALIAAVMSAKMERVKRAFDPPIVIEQIPLKPPPPAEQPKVQPRHTESVLEQVQPVVPVPVPTNDPAISTEIPTVPGLTTGTEVIPQPIFEPVPLPPIARVGPRFDTPGNAVRPPYPASKIASGQEASLKLRLAISDQGRVVAVEPIGQVDAAFFASARKHLLAKWRYKPATEGGRPVASSTVITLRFELES
jgi:protein TonB